MEITDLLRRSHDGDIDAFNQVIPLVYRELKVLAASQLRREHEPAAVQPTVLVHEAFLRIAASRLPDCESRYHFYGIAARVMRQVLVDMARLRLAAKRGPGLECPLTDFPELSCGRNGFLALHEALDRLSKESPVKGQLVELRFFAGLTAEESSATLSIPVHTVRRELRLAQAWLRRELAAA